ncbi:MAG: hypothetical protein ACXWUN_01710 [Allosphingosinicella sp.]
MQITTFLKRVLVLDAASCLGMGLLLALGAGVLAPMFGLARPLVFGAGVALVPIGLFILWVATRKNVHPLLVYLVIGGNLLWVIDSLLLIRDAAGITALGTAFVTAQAAAVAALTAMEMIGVRRARQVQAHG